MEIVDDLRARIEQIERDLAHRQVLMTTLVNSAYEPLMVIDEQHKIIAVNSAAQELFQRENPLGQTLLDMTSSPELDIMVNDALVNQEEIFEDQLMIDRRVYRVRTQVIREQGTLFIGLALLDISELVRLNRARRDMVANISHELRNPIAKIRLIIDKLFDEDEKPKRKQSISSLRAIARETDALLWMADELLDLSMIESGQALMRMVPVSVREMTNEVVERMEDQSAAKELEIVSDIPKSLQALCDREKVQRVLINLIHNAIKWSPPGESIMVTAVSDGDEVRISVLDNGPGVPDEYVERIFERFYQVDSSRSGSDGTGLGLAICKHIVIAHGGKIWAEGNSKVKGGHFHFTLPKAE